MTKSIKMWLLGIFSLFFLLPVKALQPQDSIRFSLLTCAPGSEIYALFGHTALRYQNFSDQTDLVFNYGMFSFNTPHFVFRFVKGETDYQLGATDYAHFAAEYAFDGRSVWQQTLNLSKEEKAELIRLRSGNSLPCSKRITAPRTGCTAIIISMIIVLRVRATRLSAALTEQ